jgi:PKD repeat protein/5-hydroxyisourate hydrolase-like protein (transthyretin family)
MRKLLVALILAITPVLIAADPGVELAFDQPNDPTTTTIEAGQPITYTALATTAVDLGNTDVENKEITVKLVNLTDNPHTITTLHEANIPDDHLCYPEGCENEYQQTINPQTYADHGEYQIVTKVEQTVNGNHEATTKTISFTAEPKGTLNIEYIGCNDYVVQGNEQRCTTQVTDAQTGTPVEDATFTLRYQDNNDELGTCTTNSDGYCAVETTVDRPHGDYTVDATATKQFLEADNDGHPTDTFTVLKERYEIRNLNTWNDTFQTKTSTFLRGNPLYSSFDVYDPVNDAFLGPNDDIVTDVTLKIYNEDDPGSEPVATHNLTNATDSDVGAFTYKLDQIPLSDAYLGTGKLFVFAINYTTYEGGQASKTVTMKNNELTFTPINDKTIPQGQTQTLSLADNINDLETPDDNIAVDFTNTGPYTITETGTLDYDITAPNNGAQQTVTVEADDTDGSTKTQQFTITTPADKPPHARFTYTPQSPLTGETVSFDASQSSDPDGQITSYEWTINGQTLTGETTTTTFHEPGTYNATLTVEDNDGLTDTTTQTVHVDQANRAPDASFTTTPTTPTVQQTVTFEATSTDPDGDTLTHSWDLDGDGIDEATGDTVTTSYSAAGDYDVTLTSSDGTLDDTATQTITVVDEPNDAPTAAFTYDPQNPVTDEQVTFDASQSTDPDGQIVDYQWTINGDTRSGETTTYTFTQADTYTVALTVEDDDGATDTTTQTITVGDANQAPNASFTISPDNPITGEFITFTDTSTDEDGMIEANQWELTGPNTDNTYANTTSLSLGLDEPGQYTMELLVEDDDGATDTATQSFTVTEAQPPTAAFTTTPNDPETGQTVTFDASQSTDPDGQITSYEWTANGVSIGSGETITDTFTNPGNYTIGLTVEDNDGLTDTANQTITVTEANQPPTASFTVSPQNPVVGQNTTFQSTGSDPDGQIVNYSWAFTGPNDYNVTINNSDWPTHVVVGGFPEPGVYNVTHTVQDDDGATDTTTGQITVSDDNDAPTASFTADPANPEAEQNVTFTSTSTDPDGQITSYEWTINNQTFTGETVTTTFPTNGTYTVTHTVEDDDGATSTVIDDITVSTAGTPPEARLTTNATATEGDTITLNASESTDADGTIQTYEWTVLVGDETRYQATTTTPTTEYVARVEGDYTASVTVEDNDGLTDTATKTTRVDKPRTQAPSPDTEVSLGFYGVTSDAGFSVIERDEPFTVRAGVSNDGPRRADDLHLTFTIPEYGYQRTGQIFNAGTGSDNSRHIEAQLPSYIPAGDYTGYIRVNGGNVHRQKTVPFTVVE